MHSFEARTAGSHDRSRIHPALGSFADEVCGTLARLTAYVGTLALIAILGVWCWDQVSAAIEADAEPATKAGWSTATRSVPAFAVSQFDLAYRTDTYQILRHPEGGRKDILRWLAADGKPAAELEIYRPGGEWTEAEPAAADNEAAGIIDSKFGAVALRLTDSADHRACLRFFKRIEQPHVRVSGWSCQGGTLPARRMAIACTLNRLALLSAGNDHKLAELFAHAELRRSDCAAAAAPVLSADWVTGTDNPHLRGAF